MVFIFLTCILSFLHQFRLESERSKQTSLLEEISGLKAQVDSAAAGLSAASRLSEQLDKKSSTIATLKQVIKKDRLARGSSQALYFFSGKLVNSVI